MEAIATMIASQNNPNFQVGGRSAEEQGEIEFGIQLLQAGLAFDGCLGRGLSPSEAAKKVRVNLRGIDHRILQALDSLTPSIPIQIRECPISHLAVGMVLQDDLRHNNGLLIVAKGQELTYQWIERLKDLSRSGAIGRRVNILMPQPCSIL